MSGSIFEVLRGAVVEIQGRIPKAGLGLRFPTSPMQLY